MPVWFKFRSSPEFDCLELDGRLSISVRDLRDRIVERKRLNLCRDFSIVITDGETYEEYKDDECLIPDNSNVIIKRVPVPAQIAGSATNQTPNNLVASLQSHSQNMESFNFDDFGNDIYPVVGAFFPNSDSDAESPDQGDIEAVFSSRFSEAYLARFQNFDSSHHSEDFLKGHVDENWNTAYNFNETNVRKQSCNVEKKLLNRKLDMYPQVMANSDFPVELKCSLCNYLFKEAVMIPCCQHSFCYKCISTVLLERSSCPKCLSAEYGIDDLLPNLSLRKAIEHINDSQARKRCLDKLVPEDVPDEESGIQAKGFSSAVSVYQREPQVPDSSGATGMGSNFVVAESSYDKPRGVASGTPSHVIDQKTDNVELIPPGIKEEQVQSLPSMLKFVEHVDESRGSVLKAATLQQSNEGKGKSGLPSTVYRKGNRNCYICGSPDHLLRNCPASYSVCATGNPVYYAGMPAYGQCYWNRDRFFHERSYMSLYGAPGAIPYDPTIFPLIPSAFQSYMPSIYSGSPAYWVSGVEKRCSSVEVSEHHEGKCKNLPHSEHIKRRTLDDNGGNVLLKSETCANERRSASNNFRNHYRPESLRPDEKPSCNRIADSRHCDKSGSWSEELYKDDYYLKKADFSCSRKNPRTRCYENISFEKGVPSDSFNRSYKEGKWYKNSRGSEKYSERGNDRDILWSPRKSWKNTSHDKELDVYLPRKHETHKVFVLDHRPVQHRKEMKHNHCSKRSEDHHYLKRRRTR